MTVTTLRIIFTWKPPRRFCKIYLLPTSPPSPRSNHTIPLSLTFSSLCGLPSDTSTSHVFSQPHGFYICHSLCLELFVPNWSHDWEDLIHQNQTPTAVIYHSNICFLHCFAIGQFCLLTCSHICCLTALLRDISWEQEPNRSHSPEAARVSWSRPLSICCVSK